MQTASKKVINAWAMYDWANSSYSLIITSAIYPAYYSIIVPQQVNFIGRTYDRAALASYSIAFSFLLIAFLSPILSSIADARGNKKSFMQFFCYLGSAACATMFFFTKEHISLGIICSIVASIGFCGSIVFYNSYLPEIAHKDDHDRISAKGFAMGYVGSVLLMLVCLAIIMMNDKLNWGYGTLPTRLSFLAVGLWWAGFAQITFKHLPKSKVIVKEKKNFLTDGFNELKKVLKELIHFPRLKKFLRAFFFYNMGVQTVMYVAVYFASEELKMETTQLILTVLIIQIVAIFGAILFSRLSKKTNNIFTLFVLIIIWIGICIGAYFIQTPMQFFVLAFCVGMVMGGIQSMSRSTYSKLLPPTHDTASYFSFYDVCEKSGTVLGTMSFGLVAEFMGGMRNSILAIMSFFIIGIILLLFVKMKNDDENIEALNPSHV